MNNKKRLNILIASAEIAPLAKVGGLADVIGSLPPAIKKLGHNVSLIMPLYGTINRKKFGLKKIHANINILSGYKNLKINLWTAKLTGTSVDVYFIEEKKYFGANEIYARKNNAERFLFFSLAAIHVLPIIKLKPDIIHCHDFHTALIPDILKASNLPYFENTKTVYTIHNLNYQGNSDIEILKTGNLTKNSLKTLTRDAQDGDINFMVQGILNADAVTTVSKTYAKEISTIKYGARLDNIIRKRKNDLYGILNGINVDFFNPAKDKSIKSNYSHTSLNKKTENKLYLQKKFGLPQDKNVALVGIVTRLAWQKGIELLTENFTDLNCQFVVLGTGQEKYEDYLKNISKKNPDKFSAKIMFDIKMAQQIYAGSDIFLMPSRFEPCGLGQMIAMRYGTVPVVRATGGLKDTVNSRVGFSFKAFKSEALYKTLAKALRVYYGKPKKWRKIQINGMKKDFSWDNSAKEYLKLYRKLVK